MEWLVGWLVGQPAAGWLAGLLGCLSASREPPSPGPSLFIVCTALRRVYARSRVWKMCGLEEVCVRVSTGCWEKGSGPRVMVAHARERERERERERCSTDGVLRVLAR